MSKVHSEAKRRRIYDRAEGLCTYCGVPILFAEFHMEHVHPRFYGGTNAESNLVASCRKCNCYKGTMSPDEWAHVCVRDAIRGLLKANANLVRCQRIGIYSDDDVVAAGHIRIALRTLGVEVSW